MPDKGITWKVKYPEGIAGDIKGNHHVDNPWRGHFIKIITRGDTRISDTRMLDAGGELSIPSSKKSCDESRSMEGEGSLQVTCWLSPGDSTGTNRQWKRP